MLVRWSDFDRDFSSLDDVRRRVDRLFEDSLFGQGFFDDRAHRAGPRVSLYDHGANLVITADVPGMTDKDVRITLHQEVLTLEGERKTKPPEGFGVHRAERAAVRFSRSITLPSRVDPELSAATVKDGVLTITLRKQEQEKPRQIAVKTA